MALPIILAFIARMGLKHTAKKAIKMAVDKFGKSAVSKATKKTVPKSKPVKKVTELQRVKAQIKRDRLNPRIKVKEPTGKDIIGKVSQNYGKPRPYGLTKAQKDGIAYLNATRGPGHTLKDLKRITAQTKKRLAMKKKLKKP